MPHHKLRTRKRKTPAALRAEKLRAKRRKLEKKEPVPIVDLTDGHTLRVTPVPTAREWKKIGNVQLYETDRYVW